MKPKNSILVIEDDSVDGELITRAFRKSAPDCTVHVVNTSFAALEYLQGQGLYSDPVKYPAPRLVTLDSKLPDAGKWDVLLWIRQQAEFRHLPVVILCGSADPKDRNLALDLGASAYHIKPQDFEEFLHTVDQIRKRWLPAA